MDRIELTYNAVDQMIDMNGKDKPARFGCGKWDAKEEFEIYKKQVSGLYTELQWGFIESYFINRLKEVEK